MDTHPHGCVLGYRLSHGATSKEVKTCFLYGKGKSLEGRGDGDSLRYQSFSLDGIKGSQGKNCHSSSSSISNPW